MDAKANEQQWNNVMIAIKLQINQRLYNQGAITKEMYTKAKECIISGRQFL